VVERAIQITTLDFRVQEGLRTHERRAELVARGASRICTRGQKPFLDGRISSCRGSAGIIDWIVVE